MKKLLKSSLLFILGGVLLTSCGNMSRLSIAKRHYRSGFYVHFGRTVNTLGLAKTSVRAKQQIAAKSFTEPENHVVISNPAVAQAKSYESPKTAIQKKIQRTIPAVITSKPEYLTYSTPTTLSDNTIASSTGDGPHRHADADVSFIVIVLCAIFLPPLGVALAYGIGSYFWIDLILTLLFFFPGMIFALIVVLM